MNRKLAVVAALIFGLASSGIPQTIPSLSFHARQLSIVDSLRQKYEALKYELLNPKLMSKTQVRQWAWEYENLLLDLMEVGQSQVISDPVLDYVLNRFIPEIIYAGTPVLRDYLFVVMSQAVKRPDEVLAFLNDAQTETANALREYLRLPVPNLLTMILVVPHQTMMSIPAVDSIYAHGGSRFLVVDEDWLDQEAAKRRLKHTLAHLIISTISDLRTQEALSNWFSEACAIAVAQNESDDFRDTPAPLPSSNMWEIHNAVRHLQQKKGSPTFHQFLRRTILGGETNTHLFKLYGYVTYESLLSEALSVDARFGRWLEDRLSIRSRVIRDSGPPAIFLLLIAVIAASILKNKDWLLAFRRSQVLRRRFKSAVRLYGSDKLEAALDKFHELIHDARLLEAAEGPLIQMDGKIEKAQQLIEEIQLELFERLSADIGKAHVHNDDSQIEWTETLCFELERLQKKFTINFAEDTALFLDDHAPTIVHAAWKKRKELFRLAKTPPQMAEGLRRCLAYVRDYHESDYFLEDIVDEETRKLLIRWTRQLQRVNSPVPACESFLTIQKIVEDCETEDYMLPFKARLQRVYEHFQVYCQLEQIDQTFSSGAVFDAIQMMSGLFAPLEAYYGNTIIRTRILSCFERNLIDEAEGAPDTFFNQMVIELQLKHLQQLIDICSKYADQELLIKYKKRIRELMEMSASLQEMAR